MRGGEFLIVSGEKVDACRLNAPKFLQWGTEEASLQRMSRMRDQDELVMRPEADLLLPSLGRSDRRDDRTLSQQRGGKSLPEVFKPSMGVNGHLKVSYALKRPSDS